MLVALAGPVSNLLIALICLLLLGVFGLWTSTGFLPQLLEWAVLVNVFLFVFNLIPIPPLDGSRVLSNLLPLRLERRYRVLEAYGPFILLLFVLIAPLRDNVLYPLLYGSLTLILHLFGTPGMQF